MAEKVLIIGAVATGPKVAVKLRRMNPDAEITIIDRDALISYGGCGIPYYVGGDISELDGLQSTSSHAVRDPKFFKEVKGVTVRTECEAIEILRREKQLRVRNLADGTEELLSYDKLVIGTGARPMRPPFPGSDLPNVNVVSNLHHAKHIKDQVIRGEVSKAVVIGAGAIGIEMAEALADMWEVETTIVEMADQILPQALGKTIATIAQRQLEENNVKVMTSEMVKKIEQHADGKQLVVTTGSTELECDMVILSAGVRANTEIAREAGLAIGQFGGIIVDKCMRTNDPSIYSGGDCVEVVNQMSGIFQPMALGSLSNRQGRIIATNINGGHAEFPGTVGNFCIKIFELGVATAGLTFTQAQRAGYNPVYSIVTQADRAHFYPTSAAMYIYLIADKTTKKVLGIEAAGASGDAVKARVDAVAAILPYGVPVDAVCALEVGYAPPYASAMDVVNNAGNTLDNILDGYNTPISPLSFLEAFKDEEILVLDARAPVQADVYVEKYGEKWMNIPLEQVRTRFSEVPTDKPVFIVCDTGARSFECQAMLTAQGFTNTKNLQGGLAIVKVIDPEFI